MSVARRIDVSLGLGISYVLKTNFAVDEFTCDEVVVKSLKPKRKK
jgi:hypothetical protein